MFDKIIKDFKWRYSILLVGGVVGYLFFYVKRGGAASLMQCPSKLIYGLPCPACGSTRATLLLFDGKFVEALWMNPLVIVTHIVFIVCGVWMLKDILTNRETFIPSLKRRWSLWVVIPLFILLALNMWWNFEKGL